MKINHACAALIGCLVLATAAFGQPVNNDTPPPESPDYGLLGKASFEWDLNTQTYRHLTSAPTGMGTGMVFNLPAFDYVDMGLSYSVEHACNSTYKFTENTAIYTTTFFYKFKHVAPYAMVGCGYDWDHWAYPSSTTLTGERFDRFVVDMGTGVEVPLFTDTSVQLGIDHDRTFRKPHTNDLQYDVTLAYRINDTFVTRLGAEYQDGSKGARDAFTYRLGFLFNFD